MSSRKAGKDNFLYSETPTQQPLKARNATLATNNAQLLQLTDKLENLSFEPSSSPDASVNRRQTQINSGTTGAVGGNFTPKNDGLNHELYIENLKMDFLLKRESVMRLLNNQRVHIRVPHNVFDYSQETLKELTASEKLYYESLKRQVQSLSRTVRFSIPTESPGVSQQNRLQQPTSSLKYVLQAGQLPQDRMTASHLGSGSTRFGSHENLNSSPVSGFGTVTQSAAVYSSAVDSQTPRHVKTLHPSTSTRSNGSGQQRSAGSRLITTSTSSSSMRQQINPGTSSSNYVSYNILQDEAITGLNPNSGAVPQRRNVQILDEQTFDSDFIELI